MIQPVHERRTVPENPGMNATAGVTLRHMTRNTRTNERRFGMSPAKHFSRRREPNAKAPENVMNIHHENRKVPGEHVSGWPGNQDVKE